MENSNIENTNMEINMENSNMEGSNVQSNNVENRRRGRRRVTLERMTNASNMQVTFSKRRSGVFKKASELCTLCGVDAGIIVFSPGQRVYSFGHPSVDALVRFYTRSIDNPGINFAEGERPNPLVLHELNMEVTRIQSLLDAENARAASLKKEKKKAIKDASYWWDVKGRKELNLEQLELLKGMMENLHSGVHKIQQDVMLESHATANMPYQTPSLPPFDAGALVPYVSMDGAGPSGTNLVPYAYSSTVDGAGPSGTNMVPYAYPSIEDGAGPSGTNYVPYTYHTNADGADPNEANPAPQEYHPTMDGSGPSFN